MSNDTVVYEIDQVVNIWKEHFEKLSQPRMSPNFDDIHYQRDTECVNEWKLKEDDDQFLNNDFSEDEIINSRKILKRGKAAGFDGLTTEHLVYAGDLIVKILTKVFNIVVELEYIPSNFRRGTQIPLYKGKNTCPLDVNNYRGITLLTCMNKMFEILI